MNNQNGFNFDLSNFKIPPDTYNKSGMNVNDLTSDDRNLVKSILKYEVF